MFSLAKTVQVQICHVKKYMIAIEPMQRKCVKGQPQECVKCKKIDLLKSILKNVNNVKCVKYKTICVKYRPEEGLNVKDVKPEEG